MTNTHLLQKNISLLDKLVSLAQETNTKSLDDEGDVFFNENINFFSKSYMVLMCAYLESYVKEVSRFYIDAVDTYLQGVNLPTNLVKWAVLKNKYKPLSDSSYSNLSLRIEDKEIDDNISGNPYTTFPFFIRLGIDLEGNDSLSKIKEVIETIVNKRNSIVHHNDDAGDIGLVDIQNNVTSIKTYITQIDAEITAVLPSIE